MSMDVFVYNSEMGRTYVAHKNWKDLLFIVHLWESLLNPKSKYATSKIQVVVELYILTWIIY